MAIVGWFGPVTGRPYVEGRLVIPRLGMNRDITFAVDTGADNVFISAGDFRKFSIGYDQLFPAPELTIGIGGTSQDFQEAVLLSFPDGDLEHVYEVTALNGRFDARLMGLPSLLGREVLNRWHLTYRPSRSIVSAEVDSSDLRIPTPPSFLPIRRDVSRD